MFNTQLDHIVIGATSLEQGANYIKDSLGVDIPAGGEHIKMGTHNLLMKFGKDLFFEVIAINPQAQSPDRPRWFNLDSQVLQSSFVYSPRLLTWVVNTDKLHQLVSVNNRFLGNIEPMSRGELEWQITIREDGSLPNDGLLPTVIQWPDGIHPSNGMADLGCKLLKLEIFHIHQNWFLDRLKSIEAESLIELHSLENGQSSYMTVSVQTPNGIKVISSYN